MNAAQIKKAIASIRTRGANLDTSIQTTGLECLAHAAAHGDVTLASELVDALPKGARRLALVEWMLAYGQVALMPAAHVKKREKDGLPACHFIFCRTKAFQPEDAAAKPWHEFRKEKTVAQAFDFQASVKALLARLAQAKSKGITVTGEAEALAMLREVAAKAPSDAVAASGEAA